MPVTVQRADFIGFEALRNAVQDAPVDIVQLGKGSMTGTLVHASVGTLGISSGRFSRAMRTVGALSGHRWTLGMVLNGTSSMQQIDTAPGDLVLIKPNQELFTHFPTQNFYATTLLTETELFAYLESQQPGASEAAVLRQSAAVLATPPDVAEVRINQFRTLLKEVCNEGPAMSEEAADFCRRNILDLMTSPILEAAAQRESQFHISRRRLLREIDHYLTDAGSRPIHISEICEQFNITRRTLHRTFNEIMHIAPMTFLRHKRLCDVHSALLNGDSATVIKYVAREHGFIEQGRFAADYRKLFGELPSTTLHRAIQWMRVIAWWTIIGCWLLLCQVSC